jgi:hypothetical protein
MPGLKSLKGIGRRKSATPEPVSNPAPAPSGFRVLDRQEVLRKSLGGLDRPPLPLDHRRTWSEEESSSNRCVPLELRQLRLTVTGAVAVVPPRAIPASPTVRPNGPHLLPLPHPRPIDTGDFRLCRRLQTGQRLLRRARHKPIVARPLVRKDTWTYHPNRREAASATCSKGWD